MRSLSRLAFLTAGGAAALTLGAIGTPGLSRAARLRPATSATICTQHGVLGTFSLFLVPVGPETAGGQTYQAIVNNAALGQP